MCIYNVNCPQPLVMKKKSSDLLPSTHRRIPLGWASDLRSGFALITTLVLMSLIVMLLVAMLSLSSIELRRSGSDNQVAEAQANARMALMIAIGELQKEMGPDMRVSVEAAIFDQNFETEDIEGVDQPHWLASYESWGSWLNDSYVNPETGKTLSIGDTYTAKREEMFRRWLLSMPDGIADDQLINVPISLSGWDDSNSIIMVGEGSSNQETRAYLKSIGPSGRSAWWIGSENQKAKISLAKQPRDLSVSNWETAQGDTAEVGVGALPGLEDLDSDESVSDRLFTRLSLGPAGIDADLVKEHFFDLTSSSKGVLASVRTGHLKKDLSLLFENGKSSLPDPYRFDSGDVREPSIRPMSAEIASKPVLPGRHFASWTRMRHFYRMYRQDSDALAPRTNLATKDGGGTDGSPGLVWDGGKPVADCNVSNYESTIKVVPTWDNQDSYIRFPILTSVTYILSLRDQRPSPTSSYDLYCLSTPVYVFWNPYNVELRLPNSKLWVEIDMLTLQPLLGRIVKDSVSENPQNLQFAQDRGGVQDGNGEFITFKPGEFRVFTASPIFINRGVGPLVPGFDARNVGGMQFKLGTSDGSDKPKLGINFSPVTLGKNLFNSQYGNTPGSFCTHMRWSESSNGTNDTTMPFHNHVDWLDASNEQAFAPITPLGSEPGWLFDGEPYPVGYIQLALKSTFSSKNEGWYDTIVWEKDWRCRNWIQAPPFSLGQGLYINNDATIANTQRMDCAYEFRFGSLLGKDPGELIPHNPLSNSALLSQSEKVTAVPALELPTAPIASLAGFSGMRIEPGWTELNTINPDWTYARRGSGGNDTSGNTNTFASTKVLAYQSGITGPGIGNSFLHPIIPRTDVYRNFDNSTASEPKYFRADPGSDPYQYDDYNQTDNKAYRDYWDHVFLLNDALWDDYFVSSLADQTRPGATASASLAENLEKLADGEELANSRYQRHFGNPNADDVENELNAADGYLKAAGHLMVDGMFNVNSTSVDAWHALFAGIRERKVVYRDKSGILKTVDIPSDKRIAVSRFNVATTDQEGDDPEFGIRRDDGQDAWSGVRFLTDAQLRKLAEECVKQVKQRGPFLNFSEFINRRLSNDNLGIMGALQSAIDYDDANPASGSINYPFKSDSAFMLKASDLGDNAYETPEAAVGSRYAGIPGYVIQSDILKPIANTLSVRDDTFRIRAYGDSLDENGNVIARAWCEAIVQRVPEYCDSTNDPEVPARELGANGEFTTISASDLTDVNRRFGRKFKIQSFRWLDDSEI